MISISNVRILWKLRFLVDDTTRISATTVSISLSSIRSLLLSFFLVLARDRYYFQTAWRGLLKTRGRVETLAQGWIGCFAVRNTLHYTVGVVYIRDYFSFLSPSFFSLTLSHFFRPHRPFLARFSLSDDVGSEF